MKEWKSPPDYPEPGDQIIAELRDCKYAKYVRMEVREGEGLGHIVRWQLVPSKFKKVVDEL